LTRVFVVSVSSAFFVLRSAVLHILHSFPTRRSSDLRIDRRVHGARPACRGCCVARSRRRSESRAQGACIGSRPGRRSGGTGRSRDRKSTRLNSSHVKISYAVFCLKKKKKSSRTSLMS